MGGFGSGRSIANAKIKAENCRRLDVNLLRQSGVLAESWAGHWAWPHDGEQAASVFIRGGRDAITVSYQCGPRGEEPHKIKEVIPIAWRACRFGGWRPYFLCPGHANGAPCGRRVAKLYFVGQHHRCRHCHRLTHATRSESHHDRALRRVHKLRRALGGKPGALNPLPLRPKGMWQRTYAVKSKAIRDAQRIVLEGFVRRWPHLS